ncbi:DUF5339 domain-containing protein [Gilliamella sp. B2840]|uniref:DUF5339 domain-containing protein n=1 Tax=unclassified Gilliamella TaxID=2685620 RepID=UPI002269D777|nr:MULTISPECIES: DUF5339 domain-containing protein [unclassified Gilliamella]MCX8665785.1 DUF5339 domain-containing protein [Gilliamella sp. B2887]MCX8698130.1 DUF5339 domain-containing protein [Gilliamella sp. B3000]MCX8701332.1 DUF5339 domain-containing protein [Gilliamella sp. B2840]
MKKLILTLTVVMLSCCSAATADTTESCKVYFDKVESIYKNVPENSFNKEIIEIIKQNLEKAKQEIIAMPEDKQIEACAQGLAILKQIEK